MAQRSMPMEVATQVNLIRVRDMVMEFADGQVEKYIMVSGRKM
jgi:hypothetical protein